jgi:hypothetical protein
MTKLCDSTVVSVLVPTCRVPNPTGRFNHQLIWTGMFECESLFKKGGILKTLTRYLEKFVQDSVLFVIRCVTSVS